ncbi:phosphatidylglycerol lysyltransferase domain-containing protein [Flavihumibacter profundi]|uniref:phosphatidylglycerol lysyltransferase domain-containing protein n=1 Tax=Flavihumibacter profundi TaxID=2716883 RepID=UPI001CC465C5|nr:phosphatidylglycerol lysyltransferase domain-containing protein [Flavihumibacter profundi]MBZ5858454.1 phosphatidylglycerol lysyltransferase domain-containing protein [Flavihumibacter profundi]
MLAVNKDKLVQFFRNIHWKELLAVLFILVGIYFFRQERHELSSIIPYIEQANKNWLLAGFAITLVYIILQTGLFVYSFKSIQSTLHWLPAGQLFLKRNFISTFLPGGGITAFAYLPSMLRKENIERHKVFQGAGMQGFIGIASVILVGLPVILYTIFQQQHIKGAVSTLITVIILLAVLIFALATFRKKGRLHQVFVRYFPQAEKHLEDLFSFNLAYRPLVIAILFSVAIELAGILHLYIAMRAIGVQPSWEAAFTGYIISTLFLVISPFLKGLGAVELSLTYILKLYGFTTMEALEITLLYRLFEFWLPLLAGFLAWAWKGRHLFLRLLPPTLIFLLGMVNIFSVLTPPVASRMRLLREYLPLGSIHASNWMIILTGLVLLVTAAFLFRGLKGAWWLAVLFSSLSLLGHLTKALDYEEAILAFCIVIVLLLTRNQYRQKSNSKFINIGVVTALATFVVALIFGAIGFYYLDKRNFGIDFSFQQSVKYAFNSFLLIANDDLVPITRFGNEFIVSLKVLGSGAWIFLLYTIVQPFIHPKGTGLEAREKAKFLLSQYGNSPVDFFKVDADKLLFISDHYEGFVAYKVANGFAIVLEEPVCAESDKTLILNEFEIQCRKMGLKPAFYRIDEESLYYFDELKKKKLLIGQEGIMSIKDFTLEGKQNKSLRNALNSLTKKGYTLKIHTAPLSGSLVNELKAVSDAWLTAYNKSEIVFSQGMFDPRIITNQDIIALHDSDNMVVAFLNIIPDYTPDECTYDLIRKTEDAPGGSMDALLLKLAEYGKEKGLSYLNLGLVPMSGITQPENTAERVVKYAYEKIKRFRHYQGLREFKEKYATEWVNKYLVYENDFDLVQLPAALNKVMQPEKMPGI